MKVLWVFLIPLVMLTGCVTSDSRFDKPDRPQEWIENSGLTIEQADIRGLQHWWKSFEDLTLDALVETALLQNPDRNIAEARIMEARGLRRSARSTFFPQVSGAATAGREDTGQYLDGFYEAGFDVSFELDVFGRNRRNLSASEARIASREAEYNNVTLTLIADLVRSYIELREAQKKVVIGLKNLDIQEQTLELILTQRELGEAPQLDVERAETLVNTTRATIIEFERQAESTRLQLTVLTGLMPEHVKTIVEGPKDVASLSIRPVLLAPADVLALRPDIRAAEAFLAEQGFLKDRAIASLFPSFNIGGFFGVADNALLNSATIWNVALGTAVSLIDFGRIEGQIEAAEAVERQAFEAYRKTLFQAVTEVETALSDYAHVNRRFVALDKAYNNANAALDLSQQLYREGEISFLDVLDAQRTLNDAELSLVDAEAERIKAVIRLYKALGIY